MNDAANARAESLSVQVQGGHGEPERLFVLSRRHGDHVVEVREFRFAEGETAGPLEYTSSAADLLATFERAHRDRRRLSEEMHRIRNWLGT
jgi:hypothetical protein